MPLFRNQFCVQDKNLFYQNKVLEAGMDLLKENGQCDQLFNYQNRSNG